MGENVVVTGATGGIGRAAIHAFLAEGAQVVATDRPGSPLDELVADLGDPGGDPVIVSVEADVSIEADVVTLMDRARDALGRIDVLVNVAGITGVGLREDLDVTSMTLESWARIMAVNLGGVMLTCRTVIPWMLRDGGGSIVNVSSKASVVGGAGLCAYSASKAGVNSLTLHIAKAFGRRGIRCNAVLPGLIVGTDATRDYDEAALAAAQAHVLGERHGVPTDVAEMIVFLASPRRSGFVNGQLLNCDGGVHI